MLSDAILASTLALCISLAQTASPPCLRGFIPTNSNTTCTPCPRGTYNIPSSPDICLPCPLGTYSPVRAAQTPQICRPCPPFTFSVSPRATSRASCLRCPFAIYSAHRTCLACPKDYELSAFPYTTCRPCAPRALTTMAGINLCTAACIGDNVNNTHITGALGNRTCTSCPPGTGATDFGCKACNGTAAEFNDGTFSGCRGCPPGFRGAPARAARRCVPCPRGTARDTFVAGAICYPCPSGFNTNIRGGVSCVPDDTKCPSNFFRNRRGACDRCSHAQRYDVARGECVPCAEGQASEGGLAKRCERCERPAVAGENGCVCPPGTQRRVDGHEGCVLCKKGSVNAAYEGRCTRCEAGSFAPREGMTECKECALRFAAVEKGAARCVKCGKGLIGASLRLEGGAVRNACVSRRTLCARGEKAVQTMEGLVVGCSAKRCAAGTFAVRRRSCATCLPRELTICERCSSSERYDAGRNICTACAFNEVSAGGVSRRCLPCAGAAVRVEGRCVCASGARGDGREVARGIVRGRCVVCGTGSFGVRGGSVCLACPKGTAQAKRGMFACEACAVGWFSAKVGATRCERCAEGLTSIVRFSEGSARLFYTTVRSVGSANCVRAGALAA